jgi:hypothetical protein
MRAVVTVLLAVAAGFGCASNGKDGAPGPARPTFVVKTATGERLGPMLSFQPGSPYLVNVSTYLEDLGLLTLLTREPAGSVRATFTMS